MASEQRQEKKKDKTDTGTDEKIQFAVKRKAEGTHEGASPIKMKIGGLEASSSKGTSISMKVGQLKSTEKTKEKTGILSKPKKGSVAAAFNDESDEEEEIPKEAKMRMRNLGKDTITSSGPNSFNKSKQGFTNYNKVREKEMKLLK